MIGKSPILLFASTLAGKFSNYEQAQNNPKDFAHINIYFRPLDWSILNGPWFYSEQSYDHSPWSPYRQGIHKLSKVNNIFIVENYSINEPDRIAGSGFMPELLSTINKESFSKRSGCAMHFIETSPGNYLGKVEPGRRCQINKDGKITYLVNRVELNECEFKSLDEGIEVNTNKKVWGSENGPLNFKKIELLDKQITGGWLQLT